MSATVAVDDLDGFRQSFLTSISIDRFGDMAEEELGGIRVTPLSFYRDPQWVLPPHWLPPGPQQALGTRTINFASMLPEGFDGDAVPLIASLKRAVFYLLMFPRLTQTGIKQSKPSTTLHYAKILIRMARDAIAKYPSRDGKSVFRHLTEAEARNITVEEEIRGRIIVHLRGYAERGLPVDIPLDQKNESSTRLREPPRRGQPFPKLAAKGARSFQPFPDLFVSEIGWRSLHITEILGPSLLEFWSAHGDRLDPDTAKNPLTIERRKKEIQDFPWRAPNGTKIDRLPFKIALRDGEDTVETDAWPPSYFGAVAQMVGYLQMSHATLISVSTGARWHEHAGARIGTLETLTDGGGRWHSRTWKFAKSHMGREREWPLPPEAVRAIHQQERLARLMHPSDQNNHLWVRMRASKEGPAGSPLQRFNETYEDFVHALGLDDLLDGIRPHSHRWRKTIARLAAMALVGAPKILMDLFGHSQIDMTLKYILSNPDIATEIADAAKAYLHALGTQTFKDQATGDLTGSGTQRVIAVRDLFRPRTGEDTFGTSSLDEAVDILVANGRSFGIVRPGIICLKNPAETGPCTRTCSIDTGRCTPKCHFRVASRQAERDAETVVERLVIRLQNPALSVDKPMAAEAYRGQLAIHLSTWPSIREKWAEEPIVAAILAEAA